MHPFSNCCCLASSTSTPLREYVAGVRSGTGAPAPHLPLCCRPSPCDAFMLVYLNSSRVLAMGGKRQQGMKPYLEDPKSERLDRERPRGRRSDRAAAQKLLGRAAEGANGGLGALNFPCHSPPGPVPPSPRFAARARGTPVEAAQPAAPSSLSASHLPARSSKLALARQMVRPISAARSTERICP